MRPGASSRVDAGIGRRALGRAGVGAFGLLAGLGPRLTAAQAEVVEEELRMVTPRTFDGLDPTHGFSASRLRQVGAAEGLLRITRQGGIEPELASSYEMLDPTMWRVELRPDVTFWSGRPVDALAVVESLERARALVPFAATLLAGVQIERIDDRTLHFWSEQPIPSLPTTLAGEWLVIHNAESYGPEVNSFDLAAADLTGPFRITAFEPAVRVFLERNPTYWGVRPRTARIHLDVIPDPDARTLAALSGEAHLVQLVNPASARQIERSRTTRLVPIPADSIVSAYVNPERPQFSDVRVRQALAWAVDREELVALAHDGWSAPVPSWLGNDPNYPEARRVGYTRQDLARAAQLLDEAGWRLTAGSSVRAKDGVPLKFRLLWMLTYRPLAEVLQEQWRRIGADVEVQGSPDVAFLRARRAEGNWDAFLEGWGTFGDPAAVLSRHVGATGDINYGKLVDPVTEELLAGFVDLTDPEDRRQQALRINERHAELVPFIPLTQFLQLNAVSRRLRNYDPHFLPWVYEVHPDLWVSA